ncbi:MAG: MarC family protein [Bacteroidaceae bacterium]|nr:NAAT family transporter [Candidatus Minthousia equi]MCQ2246103.1 MarC family protein [Bacteroidaceae bacterium]MDO4957256.1 MarC family protein [Bacteroidales bacterium]
MGELDFQDIVSAFVTLFAVIDIIGSIPVIISMKEKGRNVSAIKASGYSLLILVLFFFAGNSILSLFQVDVESFAVAGAIILFLISVEMLLDVELFKNQGPSNDSTLVPLVFPLIAGAGSFVTLLSLKAECDNISILVALVLNMIVVFFVLRSTDIIHRFLGKGGVYMLRKFFGIILMAMAAHLFTVNVVKILNQVQQ